MEVGLFVLGVLVGVGLAWYMLERFRPEETPARKAKDSDRKYKFEEKSSTHRNVSDEAEDYQAFLDSRYSF